MNHTPSTPAAPMSAIPDDRLLDRVRTLSVLLLAFVLLAGALGVGLRQELRHTQTLKSEAFRLQALAVDSQRARMRCEWRNQ